MPPLCPESCAYICVLVRPIGHIFNVLPGGKLSVECTQSRYPSSAHNVGIAHRDVDGEEFGRKCFFVVFLEAQPIGLSVEPLLLKDPSPGSPLRL